MNVVRTLGLICVAIAATPAAAQDGWSARKCTLYAEAVTDAIALQGVTGLGAEFRAQNAAFIAAGCPAQFQVCARSDQEIALADLLTVMTMNEGMASTFVPFGCDP